MSKLSLDALTVESFETQGLEAPTFSADKKSRNYTDCGSCGIACTAIDCPVVSANYTDCGSCGIACTSIEC